MSTYSSDGVIYAINHAGQLLWYRHDGRNDGSNNWRFGEGKPVGHGWNFRHVFYGGDGIIYAINDAGELLWYRHDGRNDGSNNWRFGEGKPVGHGWNFRHVFYGGDGIIYAITLRTANPAAKITGGDRFIGGDLYWYRHEGRNDGTEKWTSGPRTIAHGWGSFMVAFSGDEGYRVYGSIGAKYAELGGPQSWLGWPTSDELDFVQGGRVTVFERGAIYCWPDTEAIELGQVSVAYKGLYCFGETDELSASDEPYVVFGVVPAPPCEPSQVATRIYENVDSGDVRPDHIELYRGLPSGLALGVALCEHDEGDPNKYLEQVKAGVALAGSGIEAGCGVIPVVGPFAAIGCAAIWQAFSPDIAQFVNGLLGTDDDVIEKFNWQISPKEMIVLARASMRNFAGIWHSLESKLLSDGEASYKVYLAVEAV